MLRRAEEELRAFPGRVDAILGYMDFPVSTMLPLLCRRFGLRSVELEALLRCEHKYWSRLEQRAAIPEHVPGFAAFDPFTEDPLAAIDLDFPFWVKPIKSAGSHLGFRVNDEAQLREATAAIRAGIGRYGDPFNRILARAKLPDEVARVDGNWCLAEEIIGGRQCTVEGSVSEGRMRAHGIVDSVRYPNRSSFLRYQYPSRLPVRVQRRMRDVSARFLDAIGYDDAAFNAEFFWDEPADRLWLLEVNTRVAQHHSDLFEKVDGATNHQVTLDVAFGEAGSFPHREGPFACAGTFFLRAWEDAEVLRVPTREEIARIEREIPGTVVEVEVREGMRLSELPDQESYSFVYAILYLGARGPQELRRRFFRCRDALPFRFRRPRSDA
jgi:biotin carboxylase